MLKGLQALEEGELLEKDLMNKYSKLKIIYIYIYFI